MYGRNCGQALPENAKACSRCGTGCDLCPWDGGGSEKPADGAKETWVPGAACAAGEAHSCRYLPS